MPMTSRLVPEADRCLLLVPEADQHLRGGTGLPGGKRIQIWIHRLKNTTKIILRRAYTANEGNEITH